MFKVVDEWVRSLYLELVGIFWNDGDLFVFDGYIWICWGLVVIVLGGFGMCEDDFFV